MRYVHAVLCAVLLVFAALQYNDPDWYFWGPVYLLAAAWSFLAFRRPELLAHAPFARIGAPLCLGLFLIGFAVLARHLGPGWIHVEEARESLGYLICAAATALAVWDGRRREARAGA